MARDTVWKRDDSGGAISQAVRSIRLRAHVDSQKSSTADSDDLVAPSVAIGMFSLFIWGTMFSFLVGTAASFALLAIIRVLIRISKTNAEINRLLFLLLESRAESEPRVVVGKDFRIPPGSLVEKPEWRGGSEAHRPL